MKVDDRCKHCGGILGIHHFTTRQCPVGGREAPVGKKQEYLSTTFEPECQELEDLGELIRQLSITIEKLSKQVDRLTSGTQEGQAS